MPNTAYLGHPKQSNLVHRRRDDFFFTVEILLDFLKPTKTTKPAERKQDARNGDQPERRRRGRLEW
jgi:hypothetical protein